MSNIKTIKVDGEVIAVGMSVEFSGKRIAKIEEFGGNINDPRNKFPRLGYIGYDDNDEMIVEIQATSAVVYY